MNKIQKEIIDELKYFDDKLGHSPKRREVPSLAIKCYKHFGSFNKAKIKASLSTVNTRIDVYPKNAFRKDKDLAAIVSYLTFDGHLYSNFKGLMYSSKNIKDLEKFDKIMKRKFGLPPRYHIYSSGGGRHKTHKIYFFNKKVCEELFKSGVPKGDKVIQKFDVPEWIVSSREFSREYLKIAFFCEGSFKESKGRTPRIIFTTAKSTDIIDSGINFINTLKEMLIKFNISTQNTYLTGYRNRIRDNKITRDIRFRINIKDNNKFISEIGWLK